MMAWPVGAVRWVRWDQDPLPSELLDLPYRVGRLKDDAGRILMVYTDHKSHRRRRRRKPALWGAVVEGEQLLASLKIGDYFLEGD